MDFNIIDDQHSAVYQGFHRTVDPRYRHSNLLLEARRENERHVSSYQDNDFIQNLTSQNHMFSIALFELLYTVLQVMLYFLLWILPVSGGGGDMNKYPINGTTVEISACTFMCYLCFVIIDHETKKINQWHSRWPIKTLQCHCCRDVWMRAGG